MAVDTDRIFVALNIFGVSRTIPLDILNVFWQDRAYCWSSSTDLYKKLKFYIVYGKMFFLIDSFLVAEDYDLPKSSNHILSAPLYLECVRILSWSISFSPYFNCLSDDALCKIAIWADDNVLNSSCDKPSDLSKQVVIWS